MSAKQVDGAISYPNNSALGPYLRVKQTAGFLVVAGSTDEDLGVLEQRALATDTIAGVRVYHEGAVLKFVANGAITLGAPVYTVASGKVSATPAGKFLGLAVNATAADGAFVGVHMLGTIQGRIITPVAALASGSRVLLASESGGCFTNDGAAGAVTFTLPVSTPGLRFLFVVKAAQQLRIDPDGGESVAAPTGVQGTSGQYINADADGEMIEYVCVKAGSWNCVAAIGTWTLV